MTANLKKLIEEVPHKSTKELIEDHAKEVIVDEQNKSVTIVIDRKYALNELTKADHISDVIKWVKKAFWEDFGTTIKAMDHSVWRYGNEHHDREMNIPHTIHYS